MFSVTHGVIQNETLRNRFKQVQGYSAPSQVAIEVLIAAYTEGDEWLDQLNEYLDGNFDAVLGFIAEKMPYAKAFRSEGTYMLWLDLNGTGLSHEEITDRIASGANVGLEGGTVFDPDHGHGFQRVCLSTRRELLLEAFERIAAQFV